MLRSSWLSSASRFYFRSPEVIYINTSHERCLRLWSTRIYTNYERTLPKCQMTLNDIFGHVEDLSLKNAALCHLCLYWRRIHPSLSLNTIDYFLYQRLGRKQRSSALYKMYIIHTLMSSAKVSWCRLDYHVRFCWIWTYRQTVRDSIRSLFIRPHLLKLIQ